MDRSVTQTTDYEPGRCRCGCGQNTGLAKQNDPERGRKKGEPNDYLPGHHRRKSPKHLIEWMGYETACWTWQLATDRDGYGKTQDSTGRRVLAHRLYYELNSGRIPPGRQIDHLCRVRHCVNPEHMEIVSGAENSRRGSNTKLTEGQVGEIRLLIGKQIDIARIYEISQGHVSRIRNGKTWRDLPLEDLANGGLGS
jgi:HNH endonuclease